MSTLDATQTTPEGKVFLHVGNYHKWFPYISDSLKVKGLWYLVLLEKGMVVADFEKILDKDEKIHEKMVKIERNIKKAKAMGEISQSLSTSQKFLVKDISDPSLAMAEIMKFHKKGGAVSIPSLLRP